MAAKLELVHLQPVWEKAPTAARNGTRQLASLQSPLKMLLVETVAPNLRREQSEVGVVAVEKARRERRRALMIPREHGAWGLLLVPMITGAGVAFHQAFRPVPFALLLIAALALFWLRTPVESLLGTSAIRAQTKTELREVAIVIAVLGTVAIGALVELLWAGRNPALWLIGAVAGVAFLGQALLKLMLRWTPRPSGDSPPSASAAGTQRNLNSRQHFSHRLRMLSEIVGTVGLTSAAPAAYYVVTGKLGLTAWLLWLANLFFAGNQIHYVQLRIHSAKIEGFRAKLAQGWSFAVGQAVMTIALTVASVSGLMPQFLSLAFVPVLFRGWFSFIQRPAPLRVRRLGWSELAHAVTFCLLFIIMAA
ncbi:MAG TPA: YwiC-like family protein [Candidatus Acidoferrum sp.]|nr:YwiC-like family protein [Candidatus Acidoferrum sp.]